MDLLDINILIKVLKTIKLGKSDEEGNLRFIHTFKLITISIYINL